MQYVWYQTDDGRQLGGRIQCPAPSDPPAATPPPGPTADRVYQAFKAVPLPASDLHVQPADGRTLVHFKTNFFTDGEPMERSVDLAVGPPGSERTYRVDFHIVPAFVWDFGDQTTAATASGGRPYPALEVTHEYQRPATVTASVTTTYRADYRVDGGAWAAVTGTVTMTGASASITVLEARPVLTD